MQLPVFSGEAGIRDVVRVMREPAYVRLMGKCAGGGLALGVLSRRLPPAVAVPTAMIFGVYVGLATAGWLEEEAARKKHGPVIDATASEAVPAVEAP